MAERRNEQRTRSQFTSMHALSVMCALTAGISLGVADSQLSVIHYARAFEHPDVLEHAQSVYRLALGLTVLSVLAPFVVHFAFKEKKK